MGRVLHLPAATVLLVETLKWGSCRRGARGDDRARAAGCSAGPWPSAGSGTSTSPSPTARSTTTGPTSSWRSPCCRPWGWRTCRDQRRSEAAGFALRAVQLAAVATYFLSAWAKIRFGGWDWVNSATMVRAVVRRGTPMAQWLLEVPWTLHWFQWVLFTAELTSPVIFLLSERWRRRIVAGWFVFHAMTYAAITIAFWPHLVMMLAFLPLEQYAAWLRDRWARRGPTPPSPPPELRPDAQADAGPRMRDVDHSVT